MKLPAQYGAIEPLDFLSRAFCDAALLLVHTTGCSLMLCRQELFISEGDMQHATLALLAHKSVEHPEPPLH